MNAITKLVHTEQASLSHDYNEVADRRRKVAMYLATLSAVTGLDDLRAFARAIDGQIAEWLAGVEARIEDLEAGSQ